MKGQPVHDALRFSSTLLAGSLAGMELASWAVVHPAVARLSHLEQVHAEKALYRRFAQIQAPQMALTIIITGVTAAASEGVARTLSGVATGCFAGMLALTFAGNMPINLAILRWEEPGDPARWRQLRDRWDRIHTLRILLDTSGFALLVAACLEP